MVIIIKTLHKNVLLNVKMDFMLMMLLTLVNSVLRNVRLVLQPLSVLHVLIITMPGILVEG